MKWYTAGSNGECELLQPLLIIEDFSTCPIGSQWTILLDCSLFNGQVVTEIGEEICFSGKHVLIVLNCKYFLELFNAIILLKNNKNM